MAEDPRLGAFLDQWSKDQRDGVTIRSVHNRLTGLQQRYDVDRQDTRDRLKTLETKTEATEKQQASAALADAIAEGTGRHNIVTPMQAFTPAFGTQVPVELRKPDTPPPKAWWARDAFKIVLKAGGPSVAALVIGWFGHAAATPAPPPAMASVETHPSTLPAPPPVATVEVPAITVSASASASAKRPPTAH